MNLNLSALHRTFTSWVPILALSLCGSPVKALHIQANLLYIRLGRYDFVINCNAMKFGLSFIMISLIFCLMSFKTLLESKMHIPCIAGMPINPNS